MASALEGVDGDFDARQRIVALARVCAALSGAPPPGSFADDPASPDALLAELDVFDADQLTVDHLGSTWEHLLGQSDRRSQGAHFTPTAVADRVADLGFGLLGDDLATAGAPPSVWDPACGGGAFLLAAARWLEANTTLDRTAIVSCLYASDIDTIALDVCDAALEIWSGGTARPVVACGDALLDLPSRWPTDFTVVIGNPPFLGQLTADTTRTSTRSSRLSTVYAAAQGAYVDEAGLFVELAITRTAKGGVAALVLPESILGARDAEAMRSAVTADAHLARLWIDEGQSFEAAVDVVAVFLQRHGSVRTSNSSKASTETLGPSAITELALGVDSSTPLAKTTTPDAGSWAPLLASARGIPPVTLKEGVTVGDRAVVTAGFRQHFYGIADAITEATATNAPFGHPKLLTSGAIEPLRSLWGTRTVKFAGNAWNAPLLVLDAIEDENVRNWFDARCVPKLLLASQTKVVEAVVDPTGGLVPSVPVISIEPTDPADLWHLAAALTSPAVSAWMLAVAAGTGLSHDAIRLRAATLATVPLPTVQDAWDAGARAAQMAHESAAAGDMAAHVDALTKLAAAMNAAYGVKEHVGSWWWERLRLPTGS